MRDTSILAAKYAGKRVFVTGHTGFKGSWLLVWLRELGAQVKGFALAPENQQDLYNLIQGQELCDSIIGDIRDREKLSASILQFQPDFIFHLAAQPLVRRSYEVPAYTFETNVIGTINVLEAMRSLQKPCVGVFVTTDKVYKNDDSGASFKESDPLGGFDPYSASKAASEIAFSSYRDSFFNQEKFDVHQKAIASARAGNVIGGGDRAADRIIPDIIRGIEKDEKIVVRNPRAVRPWQHVLEPLFGYLLLGALLKEEPREFSEAWNFGPYTNDVLTVEQVVQTAIKFYGKGVAEMPALRNQPHEAHLLTLDITKAIEKMKWRPKLNSSEAIKLTIDWYKQAKDHDAYDLTRSQILNYLQRQAS